MGQIVKVYKDGVGYQVLNTNNIGDALEAGDNISINGNEISAVDTKYSAGTGLRLSGTTFSLNVNYGADLSLSIDPSTFVLTAQLKDQNGSNIGSAQTIDLPLESVVVSGTYNAQTKEVELTLQSGSVIRFSVADLVSGLQEELIVGDGINIDANNEISVDTSVVATQTDLDTKQDTLTAGTNIQIDTTTNTISATDTKYSAGTGINIDANNVISSTVTPGQTYTAGNGINIDQNNEISVDTSVVATQTDIANFFDKTSDDADDIDDTNSTNKFVTATDKNTWNGKQDELIAGTNIQIAADGKTISATDTKYSAGDGIDIDQNNEISVDNTIARVDDINTKIFQLSGTSDFTNAQAIYDWYDEGKLPVIEHGLKLYTPSGSHIGSYETQLYVYFESIQENVVSYIYFIVDDDEVSSIYIGGYNLEQDYLRKNNNYYYVPTGNYNPATKKYVDDAVASITPGQTYTAGNGINIDANNEISNTLPGPTIAATAPTGTEGALWYDTTNDVLKTYNGTNWIAVGEDSNMKMFIISGYGDNTTGQAIYDYYKSGKTPFARWGNIVYAVKKYSTSGTSFQLELSAGFHGADVVSNTYSASYEDELVISGDNDVVNATMPQGGEIIKYLATDENYSTPYTPQYNGSPATKKYVDDNIVTYTAGTNISIDANNEISAVDTKYSAGTGINIDSNNVISATTTPGQTYTAGNGINISQNNEISADTSVVATKTDISNKVSKGTNQSNGQLFSIENTNGFSNNFGPDYIRVDFNDGTNSSSAGIQWDSLGAMADNKISNLTSDSLALKDDLNLTQTTYAEGGITVVDDGYGTSEAFEFAGGGNNQIARLKDVKTYTAGTGLTLNGTTFSADTTVLATKQDIADLGSFEVVASLPSVSTADTKTIYLLGPIGTGADKYEERIVTGTEGTLLAFDYPGGTDWQYMPNTITFNEPTTLTFVSKTGDGRIEFNLIDSEDYYQIAYCDAGEALLFPNGAEGWYYGSNIDEGPAEYVDSSSCTFPAGTYQVEVYTSYQDPYDSIIFTTGTPKTWTKIGETSIDLSGYATTSALNSGLATKQNTLTASTGISINANNEISNTLPGPTIAATAPTGTEGALWYDTTNNVLMAHDGTAWKEAGTQMKVLSYGHSTWQDFIDAYNENAIVYCRASSNANPGSGVQGRMAFMAFVSINSSTGLPTNVEFQYYRSRSDHNTQANQLDEVYVYKLESNGTWTVTQRNTGAKAVAGTGINLAFGSGNMTISADTTTLATKTDLNSKQDTLVSGTNIKSINNESLLGTGNITIPIAEIGLSTATGNLLTSGAKIWVGDESDLPATQDSNTVYLCAEQTSGTPRLPAAYQEIEYIESGVNGDSQYVQFNLPRADGESYDIELDCGNVGFSEGVLMTLTQSLGS